MLLRDKYESDSVRKYFPDFSIMKYLEHIGASKPYYSLVFNQTQAERWKSWNEYSNNWVFATFCVAMLPVIFHKRIPGLKRFTGKLGRIMWGIFFIFVPASIVSQYFSSQFEKNIQQSYQIRNDEFMRYRLKGDILEMNDKVRFADI